MNGNRISFSMLEENYIEDCFYDTKPEGEYEPKEN